MGDSEITNILNLRNEAPKYVRFLCASTPSGRRSCYYSWCYNATTKYQAIVDLDDIGKKVSYDIKTSKNGNGWTEFYAPSTVNKELLNVNEDTGISYIQQFRNELTEQRFEQEVLANFGEEASGVFLKRYLDYANENGHSYQNYKYYNEMNEAERAQWIKKNALNKKILGVDWDKIA